MVLLVKFGIIVSAGGELSLNIFLLLDDLFQADDGRLMRANCYGQLLNLNILVVDGDGAALFVSLEFVLK